MEETKTEAYKVQKKWWNENIDIFFNQQYRSMAGTVTLYNMTRAMFADRVLEVGCGPGLMPSMFCESLMKKKSTYMITDLSESMIDSTSKLIKDGSFTYHPKHKLVEMPRS